MRSGNLKSKIIIQEHIEENVGGAPVYTWVDFLTTYSSIVPRRGREVYTSEETYASMTHTISMRYKPGITSAMRVKFGELYFEIIAPPVDVRFLNKTIELYCREWEGDVSL